MDTTLFVFAGVTVAIALSAVALVTAAWRGKPTNHIRIGDNGQVNLNQSGSGAQIEAPYVQITMAENGLAYLADMQDQIDTLDAVLNAIERGDWGDANPVEAVRALLEGVQETKTGAMHELIRGRARGERSYWRTRQNSGNEHETIQ